MDWESLIELDRQLLLAVNGSESLYLDTLVHTLTTALTWVPLYVSLFYLVLRNNDSVVKILLIVGSAALCVILAGTIDDTIVKPLVGRWRPAHDPQIGAVVDIVNDYRGGRFGFFSAHACNTFSIAVFFSILVRSRLLALFLVTWSFINCWTRLYLGVHFPGDILVGLVWGAIVGIGVYILYWRVNRRFSTGMGFISSKYTSTGYQKTDINIVITILMFTYIYALLRACIF
jgi:undecaprenyl-diphosphatase